MEYKLSQLVDAAKVQSLTDILHKATGVSVSVINTDGTILADSGWQEVCLRFHYIGRKTRRYCRRGETSIAFDQAAGQPYNIERCRNGLIDASGPVTVLGQHVANFVAGQFLLQPPDMKFFKRQARQSGFDEPAYIKALSKIPVIDEAGLRAFLQCFSILTEILGEAGVTKVVEEMDLRKQLKQHPGSKSRSLNEVATTLRVLLKQREKGKSELEEDILSNVKDLILPYMEKLKKSKLSAAQVSTIDTIEANLNKITSPIMRKMQTLGLTAREAAVAFTRGRRQSNEADRRDFGRLIESSGVSPVQY